MKTSELTGAALDLAVAKCEGLDYSPITTYDGIGNEYPPTNYSTDWAQGGPIIEREGICMSRVDTMAAWDARIYDGESEPWQAEGETALIAAMRCYVASKLGDEVDVPEELK